MSVLMSLVSSSFFSKPNKAGTQMTRTLIDAFGSDSLRVWSQYEYWALHSLTNLVPSPTQYECSDKREKHLKLHEIQLK